MKKLIIYKFLFFCYDNYGDNMVQNEFDNEIMYKLFRSVTEILHPTISKKNISNYKIIIDEDILPVRIFYPKKVSNLDKTIIYIHGNGIVTDCNEKYSDICKKIATKTDRLVIAIEYPEKKHKYKETYNDIYNTVKYLYKELNRNTIENKNICLIGDSTGASIISTINYMNKNEIAIEKEILFYPVVTNNHSNYESIKTNEDFNPNLIDNINKYFEFIAYKKELNDELLIPIKQNIKKYPSILILVGKVDSLKDEINEYAQKIKNSKYIEIPFSSHGFLKDMDKELETEVFTEIKKFI